MGRTTTLAVGLLLALTACGTTETGEPNGVNGSSTTSVTSTTTTSTTTTTTPPPADAVASLAGKGILWEPGVRYEATDFLVPLSFEVSTDGWVTSGAWDRVVAPTYTGGGSGGLEAALSFLAFMPEAEPDDIIDAILATEGQQGSDIVRGIEARSDRAETTVAGHSATTIDVYAGPEGLNPEGSDEPRCNTKIVAIAGDEAGWPLVSVGRSSGYGIGACHQARVWIVDVGEVAITIIGSTRDDERFDELMPILEDFLQNNVTFGATDG